VIVVSDTSPLNYLVLIDHVFLLERLFGAVVAPTAVAAELASDKAPLEVRKFVLRPPAWFSVKQPSPEIVEIVRQTSSNLGAGELEAISLAKELHAQLLLADERRATKEAREKHQLRVTGVLGVLEVAAILELADLQEAVGRLERTNYRMPSNVLMQMLKDDSLRRRRPS
jgi:predicted nucleic acid-binding protein